MKDEKLSVTLKAHTSLSPTQVFFFLFLLKKSENILLSAVWLMGKCKLVRLLKWVNFQLWTFFGLDKRKKKKKKRCGWFVNLLLYEVNVFFGNLFVSSCHVVQILTVCLLYEVGKGRNSWWYPYLTNLPRSYDILATFGEFEKQALQVQFLIMYF